jgi:Transposase IS116/IS110/IS902 family
MRGVGFLTATAVVAEAGDLRRFEHPRQLMAFLGLVPSERCTGDTRRQRLIVERTIALAPPSSPARQGLGKSQPQCARISPPRFDSPYA